MNYSSDSFLPRFTDAIRALPEEPLSFEAMAEKFTLHVDGRLRIIYAPFDAVNRDARVVIVGITPGLYQAQVAFEPVRAALARGDDLASAAAEAKAAADVFQLVDDRLHHGPFVQKQLVQQRHQLVFHVPFDAGNQLAASDKQPLEQFLADVSFIAKEFAEELLGQLGHWFAVVHIAGSEADAKQLAAIVDHQMEFESVEPARGGLAPLGQTGHHSVIVDPKIMADTQGRGVDEADATAGAKAGRQECGEPGKCHGNLFDESVVAQQVRELSPEVSTDILAVKVLEGAIVGVVEQDQDRHHLPKAHLSRAIAMNLAISQEMRSPSRLELDGELVQIVKQCDDVHGGLLAVKPLSFW